MISQLENDELKIYRGEDFVVSENIIIHQPKLSEICDYGERDYYSMIYQLTATPQSMKVQLWDMGIDYTKITPFELFYNILYKLYPQEKTSVIFGDLDFTKFQVVQRKEDNSIFLYQRVEKNGKENSVMEECNLFKRIVSKLKLIFKIGKQQSNQMIEYEDIIIDEFTYNMIMDYLRQVHIIYKDEKMPANETTKIILIEDDREEYKRNKNKEYHSQLKNLISSMINCEGFKYNHSQVWDMKISAFIKQTKNTRDFSHEMNW